MPCAVHRPPHRRTVMLLLVALGLAACVPHGAGAAPDRITLATWNLQWLLTPETALVLRNGCLRGERRLPCDAVQEGARSAADFHALALEGRRLGADVIALQEVEGPEAAARVFPGYRFCFTHRRGWQNVGFAIRPDIPHRCEDDETAVSLDDSLRRGAVLTLFPGEARELHLLAVHLKSGCSRDPFESRSTSCSQLRRQAPALARWIGAQAAAGRAFAILGDFNRDLRADAAARAGLWAVLAGAAGGRTVLRDAGAGLPFVPCQSGQPFTRYIDYILLGGPVADRLAPDGVARHPYRDRDAYRFRLSDHCPVSAPLRLR